MARDDFEIHDNGAEPTAVVSAGNYSLTPDEAGAFVPTRAVSSVFDGFAAVGEISEPTCIYRDE